MAHKSLKSMVPASGGLFAPVLAFAQEGAANNEALLRALEQPVPENPFGILPLISAIGFFAIIIAAMYFAGQREKRKQEFLSRFVEKEQAIPSEILPVPPSRHRELRRATWLLFLGLAVGLVLFIATGDWRVAAWSLIVLFLAVASFINAWFFYPNSGDSGR